MMIRSSVCDTQRSEEGSEGLLLFFPSLVRYSTLVHIGMAYSLFLSTFVSREDCPIDVGPSRGCYDDFDGTPTKTPFLLGSEMSKRTILANNERFC